MGTLTSDELEILSTVQRFVRAEVPPFVVEENFGTVPRKLFVLCGEHGLTALGISEKHGGLGARSLLTAEVMEEVAATNLGPAIFLSVHSMVSKLIEQHGTQPQRQRYLSKLASGELLGAFGLTEPSAGSDASALKTEAKRVGDHFELRGEKCYITSAGFADIYLVFARTDAASSGKNGISAFVVEADTKGLQIGKVEKKMGCELSPIASISFDGAKIPAENLVGDLNNGYRVALSGLAGGRVNIASCANGLSRSAIEKSIAHLKERKQFGQPLSHFQGLQFMLADMKMKYEASRLLTLRAADQLDSGNSGGAHPNLNPSIAKCFATDSAMSITTDAVQLLGGAGYIREYAVEGLMRDAKMLQIVEGTNQIQRSVIARCLL